MPDRREFVIGALGLGAVGTAELLRPRRRVRLFPDAKLDDVVPRRFGVWAEVPGGNIVAPTTPNSLADRLYSETITRVYLPLREGLPPVMLLIAYGGEQSDLLQLHRPEVCYPAVGLTITERELTEIPMPGGSTLPATLLTAASHERTENIVYWTRLGEQFPRSGREQRRDRLKVAMAGIIGDGILVRASTVKAEGGNRDYPLIARFLADMVQAMPRAARPGFIGTERAGRIV